MKNDAPLVIVSWQDSGQPTSSWQWLSAVKPSKPIVCASVGWLIQDDDDMKVVAQSFGDIDNESDIQAMGLTRIPTRAVLKIEKLSEIEELKEAAE